MTHLSAANDIMDIHASLLLEKLLGSNIVERTRNVEK
jgi:hypothetical protein